MAKKRQWILMLLAFLFAVCAVGAVSAWYADTVTVYAATDNNGVDTGFFGEYQSEQTQTVGEHRFYQYQYGCAYAYGDAVATVFWGGRQWKADLTEEKTSRLTREEVYAKTSVLDISSRVGYEHDAAATEQVLKLSNGKTVKDIGELFQARYAQLKDTVTLGVPSSGVKEWDGYIFEDFCYGESDASFNWGTRGTNYSGLCYNPGTGEVFYITGGYASAFEQLGGKKSDLGQMLSDSGISLPVDGETWTVQLFENGYIREQNGSYEAVTGVAYDEDSKTFVAQATLTGEYGDKVGSVFTVDGMYCQNFENGYAQYYLLGGDYVIRYYGNRNIAQDGTVTFVDKNIYNAEILTADIGENAEQAETIRSETGLEDSALYALFTDAMDRAVEAGFGLGVPCSPIKIWNGMIMMDFKLGDGRFSFGGDRYNMSFIVYNPDDGKAYAVSNYAVQWVNDEVFSYGLPVSDIHKDGTFKLNSAEIEYAYMQEFEQGVLYTTKDGMLVAELGVGYDEESNSYIPQVAPSVPEQYGDRTDMRTEGNYTYINYEKGCVTAERNNEGYYTYTLHPGRNFGDSSNEPTLLPLKDLIQKSDLQFDTTVNYGMTVEALRELLYSEIQRYYDAGFFVGFLEDRFKPWNDIDAQQFIWGDSTADPFKEEGRRYVAALALNRETQELYLLRDEVLNVWQDNYAVLGFPTTNSTYYTEQGISVQEFDTGFIVTDGLQAYAITGEGLESFLADFERVEVPTHGRDESSGYIAEGSTGNIGSSGGSDNTGLIIGISCAAGAVVIAAAVAAIILIRRRKKVK